jgi:23S rRNA (uracil1939-C5)-methyltransferase
MGDMNTNISPTEEIVTVQVHGLAVGGSAVGRVTGPEDSPRIGVTAFVPFVAPGETVEARIVRSHARHVEAELTAILTPSPHRISPPCGYFGICGGCDIQHLEYPAQRAAKGEMVQGAFRSGGLAEIVGKIQDVVPGPPFAYRRRIILHIDPTGNLGYYRRQSHTVLPILNCSIAVPEIDAFLAQGITFAGAVANFVEAELHLEAGENGLFAVLKWTSHLSEKEGNRLLERLKPSIKGGMVEAEGRVVAQYGETAMLRKMAGVVDSEGEAAPGVFSQVNHAINELLVDWVNHLALSLNARSACDLYAGAGNFSFPLAARGLRVTAVERVAALVTTGRSEAIRQGLGERLQFYKNDVAAYLAKRPAAVDLIIADPPRAGLGKLTASLGFAPTLVLVSCHLPSAVRDIKALEGAGWRVESVTPFDMFAQTAHIELLTVLRRA